jgi:hypothetical protein
VQFGSRDLGRLRHIRFYFGSAVRTLARAVNAAVPATARTAAVCGGCPLRTAVGLLGSTQTQQSAHNNHDQRDLPINGDGLAGGR